jgi:hypothetical protein
MIKTSIVIILGILFYTYVMSHKEWRPEIVKEKIVNDPGKLRKRSRIW